MKEYKYKGHSFIYTFQQLNGNGFVEKLNFQMFVFDKITIGDWTIDTFHLIYKEFFKHIIFRYDNREYNNVLTYNNIIVIKKILLGICYVRGFSFAIDYMYLRVLCLK